MMEEEGRNKRSRQRETEGEMMESSKAGTQGNSHNESEVLRGPLGFRRTTLRKQGVVTQKF